MKNDGTKNPADLMTKYLVRDKIDSCMTSVSQEVRSGRANAGLDIQGASAKAGTERKSGQGVED